MFKGPKKSVIELDGKYFSLSKNELETIVDIRDIQGDGRFITDMQEAVSRTLTVESPSKYADVMVKKQLGESGDFDEPVSIISHWKKSRGRNATDIFFTALPTRIYHQYMDQIRGHEDSILLVPLYSLLFNVLKRTRSRQPIVVILQHNRFADFIIGTKNRVYYSNRCVTFDEAEEQISSLWNTVREEIKSAEIEFRIDIEKAFILTWIDSGPEPDWGEDNPIEIITLPKEKISFGEEPYEISFTKAVKSTPGNRTISSGGVKAAYYAKRLAPAFQIVLFLSAILLAGGYFFYQGKTYLLQKVITGVEEDIRRAELKASVSIPSTDYGDTFNLVKELAYCQKAPPYKRVVNDLSGAFSSKMKLNILKVGYTADSLKVEMFGEIENSFDSAHKGFQRLLRVMRGKGYSIKESRFDTDISISTFLLKLTKGIQ